MTANVDQWVSRLKEAFSGIGTNEEEVTSVLNEARGQMSTLVNSYPNLEDELYDEFSGDELKQALHLFYEVSLPPSPDETQIDNQQWVSRLYEAFNNGGIFGGTDEDEITSVLQAAKNAGQMAALTNHYNQQHSDELSLEDELYDELSSDDLKTALQLYYSGFSKIDSVVKIDGTLVPGKQVSVEICLLDSNRKIIKNANCKRVDGNDKETIYTTENSDGIVRIPVLLGTKTIEIEWEPKGDENEVDGQRSYYWQTVYLPGKRDDENITMARMLNNLGFEGDELSEQKIAYEQFFAKPPESSTENLYSVLSEWVLQEPSPEEAVV